MEANIARQSIEILAERVIKLGQVTREGDVVIHATHLSKGDQLKLALIVRYIRNALDENISRTVRPTDLTRTLGQRLESIGSSLSKLNAEGFAKKEGYGEYSVFPYKVEPFLNHISQEESPDAKKIAKHRKQPKSSARSSGAGADIQRLFEEGFFDTPKFMADVIKKLREENSFHDDRVVDKIMRDTFVSSRRLLKRIQNEGPGKARWLYVVRK